MIHQAICPHFLQRPQLLTRNQASSPAGREALAHILPARPPGSGGCSHVRGGRVEAWTLLMEPDWQ